MTADIDDGGRLDPDDAAPLGGEAAVRALVDGHARFLAFLERRVGDRATAEEILQEAFARGVAKADTIRDGENATAWFYRLLRNAIVDHHRRRGAERRALEAAAREADVAPEVDAELHRTVCACVSDLVVALKPEHAEAIRSVDLGGERVVDFAARVGIRENNAAVRLHRARGALRRAVERSCGACAEHGCLDCTCHHGARPAHD